MAERARVVVASTCATGSIFGVRTLERLRVRRRDTRDRQHVGRRTLEHETGLTLDDIGSLADVLHRPNDQGAVISSGSYLTSGMIVAPCSVKTLAGIATGYSDDLVARAADVVLKEQRPL